jgi:hypothetical protein
MQSMAVSAGTNAANGGAALSSAVASSAATAAAAGAVAAGATITTVVSFVSILTPSSKNSTLLE